MYVRKKELLEFDISGESLVSFFSENKSYLLISEDRVYCGIKPAIPKILLLPGVLTW